VEIEEKECTGRRKGGKKGKDKKNEEGEEERGRKNMKKGWEE
jgi:hypothetical protein